MGDTQVRGDELRTLPLSAIAVRDGFNPRKRFDETAITRMAATIGAVGLLQPLLVRPGESNGEFELVDGERRYRAAFQAGADRGARARARPRGGDRRPGGGARRQP